MKIFGIPIDLGGIIALITLVGGIFLSNYATNISQAGQIAALTEDTKSLKIGYEYIQRSLGRIEGKLGIATDQPGWHH